MCYCGIKSENVPTQALCVLWIYIDVYMFLLPKSWSACSCLQWPKKMLRKFHAVTLWQVWFTCHCGQWDITKFAGRRNTHQVFSIWRYGHTQDVRCMSNMAILCAFPSTRYRMQFLPALNIPWRFKKKLNWESQRWRYCNTDFFWP